MIIREPLTHDQLFPDEAFDHDPEDRFDPRGVEEAEYARFVDELYADARQAIGDDADNKGNLKKEVALELAALVQAGQHARSKANELGEEYDGCWDDVVEQGLAARERLFTANAPFAAYMARKSVLGAAEAKRSATRVPSVPRERGDYLGQLATAGAYSRIASLSTSRVMLADRIQSALEGLWIATEKYKPPMPSDSPLDRTATFTTYAAYHIHNRLSIARNAEPSGWYMEPGTHQQYKKAINDINLYGEAAPISHITSSGGRRQGLPPTQALAGREHSGFEAVADKFAPEEEDVFGNPEILSLDEIVPAPSAQIAEEAAELSDLRSTLLKILDQLSEREAGIIQHRFGFEGEPKTLAEIGEIYGIRKERVRQIEAKTMAKLRSYKISDELVDYLGAHARIPLPTYVEPIADGTGHLKTTMTRLVSRTTETQKPLQKTAISNPTNNGPQASWQANPDDAWDTPVRHVPDRYPPGI